MPATKTAQNIDTTFTAPIIQGDGEGAWTYLIVPGSGEFFGTRRPVKIAGTIDGHPFRATLLPMGDGTHMLPLKAALREVIDKASGEEVTAHIQRRFS